jgi:hypothetical protein
LPLAIEKEREMFGKLKTGYKALGVLSDFNSLFKVKTANGSPSNIWGHKRTWVLLGALVAGIGPLVAGESDVMAYMKNNMEAIALIAAALYGLFAGMRAKSDEGSGPARELEGQRKVAALRAAASATTRDDGSYGASDGGGA